MFAAINFEEFVNLSGNYSHYILLYYLKTAKLQGFFYKGTRLDRKYFILKFYFGFIRALVKPDRVYRVTQCDFVYTDTVLLLSQTTLW